MNKFPALLILPVLAVILVSGCVTPTGAGAAGPGVLVLDWKPDLPTVYSEDRVKLQLRVQNQGEVRGENVDATLTGVDITEWGAFATATQYLGSLLPFDAVTETPGEVKTITWDLRAPALARGAQFTYSPIVKVSYDYRTTAQKPVTLVSEAELRRIQQEGRSLPSKTSTYSSGPIGVEIRTGDYVRTSDEFGMSYDIFPVYVRITNEGWTSGGTVIPGPFASVYEYDYPVELTITPPSGTSFVYTGFGTNCGTSVPLELFQGQTAEVTCELQVDTPPAFQEERLITATVDYRYQTEATTSLTVTGRERF
jgi:hypothetical protein